MSRVALNSHPKKSGGRKTAPTGAMPSVASDLIKGVNVGADVGRRADDRHLRQNLGLVVEELVSIIGFALALQRLERAFVSERPAVLEEVLHYIFGMDAVLHPGQRRLAMRRTLDD